MRRINIQLDEESAERLREEAFRQRASQAEIVRRALRQWLAREDGTERKGGKDETG